MYQAGELAFSISLINSTSCLLSIWHELLLSDRGISAVATVIDEAVSEYSEEASASRNLLKCVKSEVVAPSVELNNLVPARVKQEKNLERSMSTVTANSKLLYLPFALLQLSDELQVSVEIEASHVKRGLRPRCSTSARSVTSWSYFTGWDDWSKVDMLA